MRDDSGTKKGRRLQTATQTKGLMMMMKHQYAIPVSGATGDDITATILFRNKLTDLIEGLELAVDYIDDYAPATGARIDAALAVGDAIEFLNDVMRMN
jgi:hypothetical protein